MGQWNTSVRLFCEGRGRLSRAIGTGAVFMGVDLIICVPTVSLNKQA